MVLGRPAGALRNLDHDVRRLDHANDSDARRERELRGGLGGHQTHEAVRTGLHLDYGGHAVLFNARHQTRESVSCGLRDHGALAPAPILLESPEVCERDEALATRGPPHAEAAGSCPATKRVDRDPEELGGLTNTNRPICRFCAPYWHKCLGIVPRRRHDAGGLNVTSDSAFSVLRA
jgi:hypothetical protein